VLSGSESSFVSNPILEKAREHIVSVLSSEPSTIVPNNCQTSPNDSLVPSNDICAKFRNAAYLRRRTHLYYLGDGGVIGDQVSRDPYEVRLLTQLTLDRFGVLERFLGLWEGPATIVLHLTDAEAMELPRKVRESKVLRNRKAVNYHIVYKRQVTIRAYISKCVTHYLLCECASMYVFSFIQSIIHSGHFYSAPSSPQLLRSAPDTARILCRSFTPKRHRQQRCPRSLRLG